MPDDFEWVSEPWGVGLRCRPLAHLAPHVFTTRQVGVSPEALAAVAGSLGARQAVTVQQVHGRHVVVMRDGVPPQASAEADALVSNSAMSGVAVRAADCVPLLMADRSRGIVAAVHAGWRGTAAGVATAALEALATEFGTRPEHLVVAIGPAIGACCYEVGTELVDAFAAAGHARHLIDRWFLSPPQRRGSRDRSGLRLDLVGANRDQLVMAGVPQHQIHAAELCTAMHLDLLTSFRREGEQAGRLLAAIAPRA